MTKKMNATTVMFDFLAKAIVLTLVVGFIRGSGGLHDPYPAFVLCGLVTWKAFAMPVQQAVASMA